MSGRLSVVGLGPGAPELLAPAARQAIADARAVLGYRTYIELIEPELLAGKDVTSSAMTGEMERCAAAVRSAASGADTVLVCGGDPGIYGMAGLALETLEAFETQNGPSGVEVEIVPGIPALAGAAALLGAPLMHDFAVISLSDLLTPWALIEKRLACAVEGDFVIVLYNPRSRRRTGQLERALEIIRSGRSASTPAGLVRNAYRPGQEVKVRDLGGFDPGEVDMFCILVIGNSGTRQVGDRMVTPRGYAGKYGQPLADAER